MELCFISTLMQNDAPFPLPSYGTNTVFVAFIPPEVIALSIPRESEVVYKAEVFLVGLMV